jgi:quinol monooxygenase YgiN
LTSPLKAGVPIVNYRIACAGPGWFDTFILLNFKKLGGLAVKRYARRLSAALLAVTFLSAVTLCSGLPASVARADGGDGPIFNVVHFDVIPATVNGVDFLQTAYALLFKYRDQSAGDEGLESFRVLNLVPPTTNHSEIVQVWKSYEDYKDHLAQAHTIAFRFDVQGNPALGGECCIGSPIDDRQYHLVKSFKAPWFSASIPSTVGPLGALYVITYVELLQEGNVQLGQDELIAYGGETSRVNGPHVLSYNIMQQLDRPNRYAVLEVWDSQTSYNAWQGLAATTSFVAKIMPLLGSPFDHRLTILCGETYSDSDGCTPP